MSLFNWLRCRKGTAAIEFAVVAPVFVLLYVVGADLVFLMRSRFRIDAAAAQTLMISSQYADLYEGDFTGTFLPIAQGVAGKVPSTTTNLACGLTLTGIAAPATGEALLVTWKRTMGTCPVTKTGAVNRPPTLPAGYVPPAGVPLIVAEVNAQSTFTGLSATTLGSVQTHYQVALGMPRQRVLPAIAAGNRP